MLVIREEQMRAMARAALPQWVTKHLKQFFPQQCAALGDNGMRERVSLGIDRAVSYGFESEVQISQYLDLMFAFGPDFDTDSALSWPQPILSDPTLSADARMERLLAASNSSQHA